jgi:peroxiredoxin
MPYPEIPAGAKDLDGKEIRIADYKGKVVMVDFWAAWCGPCMTEAPNVVRAYVKYHPKGFEIIGISLDHTKDEMLKAVKEKGMTWRQYFDGRGWENAVSQAYGIQAIPATYLVGPDGKVITNQTRGSKLEAELENLLGAKK